MRRINSEFKTANMSEEGQKLSNRDYFGYVEMDDFTKLICFVLLHSFSLLPCISCYDRSSLVFAIYRISPACTRQGRPMTL